MRQRLSIEVDRALVNRAGRVLGTSDPVETVREALEEAIRLERRRRLAARRHDDVAPAAGAEMRPLRRYPVTGELTGSEAIEEDRDGSRRG